MLEYFTYKKLTKHKARRAAEQQQQQQQQASDAQADDAPAPTADDAVLGPDDERFLQQVVAAADQLPPPPLPPRPSAGSSSDGDEEAGASSSTGNSKKPGRLSLLFGRPKKNKPGAEGLQPGGPVTPAEGEREKADLWRVLDRLNLSARNNKVVAAGSSDLLQSFAQVFKDLVNGVPTACDDLARLLHDRDGALSRGFDKLPSSLKKLVTQLSDKVTGSLAPELMAAAAASQGIKADASAGLAGTAKNILLPHNLAELVTKPGAIAGMLKAIVEVLKTRWPAFIGMNVLWSVALSLLLFVLWYCYKRGRQVRLEGERSDAAAIDGSDRIEELPDDPMLPAPETSSTENPSPAASTTAEPQRPSGARKES